MLLKSLELQGFKTFPDKTTLHFEEGITAVVGPNGSGKSNISDAMRWVLGEQSVKTLRCSKMEDVIFSGTPARKPMGYAEITLTMDNTGRELNFDGDTVAITRRYYRSGESEYLINKAAVRLRDIHELFMDTGLGRDGYSMIGQGKIDSIVAARSEDRREIFEEAAGISRFRYRKEEAERRLEKANLQVLYQKAYQDNPALSSNPLSRWQQRQAIKKQYIAAKRTKQTAGTAAKGVGKTAKSAGNVAGRTGQAADFVRKHKKGALLLLALFLLVCVLMSMVSSCSMMASSIGSVVSGSTYPSKDEALLGAEDAYAAMEAELQSYLDNYERTHSYDEYHFDLDEIKHDPYVLMSLLTAYYQKEWTLSDVEGLLDTLFDRQYILTEEVEVETRYDSEDDPYDYYICYVTLENFDLSHLPVYFLSEEQLSLYAMYMQTLGNRPDLFPQSEYPNASGREEYLDYDVPPEALEDETFAAMLAEAEKYLGMPYVWGGSSPATSFDCSGFISWVLNHSGWNVGRMTANGLFNYCTPVSSTNAKPGDLIFFQGTYDTAGASHVGLYVGGGMMIHCGDPISYANINTSYWQSHYLTFGRLP